MTMRTYGTRSDNPVYTSGNWRKPENMRNLVSFVVLMVCTLGIYFLYWVYKTTEYANRDRNTAQQSPLVQLLLVIFIPYYELYWFYKTSKKLANLGEPVEVFNDNSIVTLLLGIFGLDIIGAVILQDQINRIEAVRSGAGPDTNGEGVCRKCHAVFPNDVHACPKCGEPYKKPFTQTVWFPIVIGALGFLLAIGLLIGGIVALSNNAEITEDGSWNWDEITSGEEAAGPEYGASDIDELLDENSQKYGEVIETAPGRWALVKEGVVNTDFTGVAENENGIWYLENGYVNFNFSGTLTDGKGTAYTIEKGQVVSQKAAE